eukprot:445180_1
MSTLVEHDSLITNEILLNFCDFFELSHSFQCKLLPCAPLSPQDWIEELSPNAMSKEVNYIIYHLLKCLQPKLQTMSASVTNDVIYDLLFNECFKRQDQFILHCKSDSSFIQLMSNHSNLAINDTNDEAIPWKTVKYQQLPILYKFSIIMNICDWIVTENKMVHQQFKTHQKTGLIHQPFFIGSNKIKYYSFGSESVQRCLYQEISLQIDKVYEFDAYIFNNEQERLENNGLYFGNLKCVGIGLEGIMRFKEKVATNTKLYYVLEKMENKIQLLELQKLQEYRKRQMNRQKLTNISLDKQQNQ